MADCSREDGASSGEMIVSSVEVVQGDVVVVYRGERLKSECQNVS